VLWRTCWGTNWEHIENLLGTLVEHSGNTLGTREKWKKILPTPNLKGKEKKKKTKQGTLSACLGLPIGCVRNLNPDQPMRSCTMHPIISTGFIFVLEGGGGGVVSVLIFYFESWWFIFSKSFSAKWTMYTNFYVQSVSRPGFFFGLFWAMNQSMSSITKRSKISKLSAPKLLLLIGIFQRGTKHKCFFQLWNCPT
jgi:hypothetical protein